MPPLYPHRSWKSGKPETFSVLIIKFHLKCFFSLSDKSYHRNLVNSIISKLGMDSCKNVRAENCSGGQQKRLSIALELIHSPNILILDEPTSGLDSVSCLQCVTLLRDLAHNADQPMAIAASIHQPTARILQNFDRIYVIAVNGQCLYDGPTDQLVPYFSKHGLACPTYHNPADFVVEIASNEYGIDSVTRLVALQRHRHDVRYNNVVDPEVEAELREFATPALQQVVVINGGQGVFKPEEQDESSQVGEEDSDEEGRPAMYKDEETVPISKICKRYVSFY